MPPGRVFRSAEEEEAASKQAAERRKKIDWRWPLPSEVKEDQLPLLLNGVRWADAERCQEQNPDLLLLKFLEERDGGKVYIVDKPLERHEVVQYNVSRELTKWMVHRALDADLELIPTYNLRQSTTYVVRGRKIQPDGGWKVRRAFYEQDNSGGQRVDAQLVLEVAVAQSLEGVLAKVNNYWFQSETGNPTLVVVIKIDVRPDGPDAGQHGFRALLLSRGAETPLVDVAFGYGTECTRSKLPKYNLQLPLDKLYGEYRSGLPPSTDPPALDLYLLKREVLFCLENDGLPVAEQRPMVSPSFFGGAQAHSHGTTPTAASSS